MFLCLTVLAIGVLAQVSSAFDSLGLAGKNSAEGTGPVLGPQQAVIVAIGLTMLPYLVYLGAGPVVGRLRLAPRRFRCWARDAAIAAVISAGVMTFLGTLVPRLAVLLPSLWARGDASERWRATPPSHIWIGGLSAGILEEFAYVVVPVAAWCGATALMDQRRFHHGVRPVTDRTYRAGLFVIGIFCVVLRFNLHTYQGLLPALGAVVWSGVNYALFLRYRSLAALIAAHTFFDGVIAGIPAIGSLWILPWLSLGIVAVVGFWAHHWLKQTQRVS